MEKDLNYRPYYKQEILLQVASFIAVVIIFHICYGVKTLLPGNINWLMSAMHDWGTHYLGWHFYKNEPWQFPIGDVTNYFYPLGTNVGFTDSIPLLAIFFKLFSKILPENFQYFGIWLFSCHLLLAYYTIRILNLFKIDRLLIFFAVIFMAANPVLVYRGLHPALCAHWLLVGSLYTYFLNPSVIKPSKILSHQFILLIISALVNPYICFMVLGFSIILPIKLCFFDKVIRKKSFFAYLASTVVSLFVVWYIVGMVSFGKKEDLGVQGGFGLYGMNLNSFYNASGYSVFLPPFKHVSWHQYEGFMYLGLGGALLVLVAIAYRFIESSKRSRSDQFQIFYNRRSFTPMVILIIAYTLFSLSHIITFNDSILFKIPVPAFIIKLGEVFRASSRFFWVIYYLMLLYAITLIARNNLKNGLKYLIIIGAVCIQLFDTKPLLTSRNLATGPYHAPISNENWKSIIKEFDQIVFYPPFQATNLTSMDYQYFCYLAAQSNKPINTGYVARFDNRRATMYSDSLQQNITEGKLSPSTLYITTMPFLTYFSAAVHSRICQLNTLDNYYYLFDKKANQKKLDSLTQALNSKNKEALDSALNILGKKILFAEIPKIETKEEKVINLSIEKFRDGENYILAGGWAFPDTTQNNKGDSIFLTIRNDERSYIASTMKFQRPDITSYFKRAYLDDAGFNAIIFKDNVEPGIYTLGIMIKNAIGKTTYQSAGNRVEVRLPEYTTVEKLNKIPPTAPINYGIDILETNKDFIIIGGWSAVENKSMEGCKIKIVLKNEDQFYVSGTNPALRPDVTAAIAKNKYNLDNSGFNAKIVKSSLPAGKYQLGIIIIDTKHKTENLVLTDKIIEIVF